MNDALVYQVDFDESFVSFKLDQNHFIEASNKELNSNNQETQDLIQSKKEELDFNANYHLEGNQLSLMRNSHEAKVYQVSFEGTQLHLISDDGQELILERVE